MKKLTVDIVISFIFFVFCSLWKASQHHLIYIYWTASGISTSTSAIPEIQSPSCDFSKIYTVLLGTEP